MNRRSPIHRVLPLVLALIMSAGGVGLFTILTSQRGEGRDLRAEPGWRCADYVVLTSCSPIRDPAGHGARPHAMLGEGP